MTRQLMVNGWKYDCDKNTYKTENTIIKRYENRAVAYVKTEKLFIQVSVTNLDRPGDFIEWLDKMTSYVTVLEGNI